MTHERSLLGLPAPAKLNLFLHVIGRRPDGKHLLQSVFILLSLHDTIDLTLLDEDRIERTGDVIGDPERDLCVRAARLIKDTYGIRSGVRIRVTKRIPAGAGMGGGSSDAATTLIGLTRLFNLDISREDLMALGEKLGADVPFFIWGRPGFVEGIGEKIRPVEVPPAQYAVIWPGTGISTAEIFAAPSCARNSESMKIAVFSDAVHNLWSTLYGRKDLQLVAEALEPRVSQARKMLASCSSPRMTGSGSAVFGVIGTDSSASFKLPALPDQWIGFIAESLEEHPLCAWLGD